MNGKRNILTVGLILVVATIAAADPVGFQISGMAVAPFAEDPDSLGDVADRYRDTDSERMFSGVEMELWIGSFGFGGRYIARFDGFDITDPEVREASGSDIDWWLDQKSDLFLAYHLFGGGALVDPYVRYGIGFAAQIDLDDGAYYDDAADAWTTERPERYDGPDSIRTASLYQYLGVGVQTNLRGLVVGVGLNYTVLNQRVYPSGSDWGLYPTERFEGRVYGGIALGGG